MDNCALRAEQITSHTDNAIILLQKLAHTPLTAFLLCKEENKQLRMVLPTLHFLHNLDEDFLREREEGIFSPGNTLILQVLQNLLFWIYGSRSQRPSLTSRPGCEGDVPFTQVAAVTLCPIVATM